MSIHEKIIEVFGSQTALADLMGINPMTVSQWKARDRIPAERCNEIAVLSEGRITRAELRPDIFGNEQAA